MIELFGDRTGNCLRVSVTFEEACIPYRVRKLSLATGEHRAPEHLSRNPTGKVPTMVDNGTGEPLVLSQSVAIMLWAARHAPNTVMPMEGTRVHARAVEQLMMVTTDMVAVSQAAFALRAAGEQSASQYLNSIVIARLAWMEEALAKSDYLAGDMYSLSDIAAATLVSPLRGLAGWEHHPKLGAWYARVSGRAAFIRGMHAFD